MWSIGVFLAMLWLGIDVLVGFYNAGKYHNGGRDVREGDGIAAASCIVAIGALIVFSFLFLKV